MASCRVLGAEAAHGAAPDLRMPPVRDRLGTVKRWSYPQPEKRSTRDSNDRRRFPFCCDRQSGSRRRNGAFFRSYRRRTESAIRSTRSARRRKVSTVWRFAEPSFAEINGGRVRLGAGRAEYGLFSVHEEPDTQMALVQKRGRCARQAEVNMGYCDYLMAGDIQYSVKFQGKFPKKVFVHGTNTAGFEEIVEVECTRKHRTARCKTRRRSFKYTAPLSPRASYSRFARPGPAQRLDPTTTRAAPLRQSSGVDGRCQA